MKKLLWLTSALISTGLLYGSFKHAIGLEPVETIGFITGGYCVWLVVLENIWNWPIGILNAIAFTVLFVNSRLYADAGLQIIYIILGFIGWYWWLRGGTRKTKLRVSRINLRETLILLAIGILATTAFTKFLTGVHDSAPFLDALTTVSSLIAQYMLTRKYFENWFVWIATDVVYIGLYAFKHLLLTSVLYAIFLTMCIMGVRSWRRHIVQGVPDGTPSLQEQEA